MAVLTFFIFILLLPPSQEHIHWFLPVGVRVRFYKYYVNDGVNLALCNGATKGVPGGVVCIGRFSSEGVLIVWYLR